MEQDKFPMYLIPLGQMEKEPGFFFGDSWAISAVFHINWTTLFLQSGIPVPDKWANMVKVEQDEKKESD